MADIKYLLPFIKSLKNDLVSARQYEAAKHIQDAERLLLPQGPPSIEERIEKMEERIKDLELRHDRQGFLNDRIATYADADLLKRVEKM